MIDKTEAVNRLLSRLRVRALDSLDGALNEDHKAAIRAIDQATREVLHEGWDFNTDRDVTLTPNSEDNIEMPTDLLSYEVAAGYGVDPRDHTIRDQKFYNTKSQTNVYTGGLKFSKLVYRLDFDELPPNVREYIAIRAERDFADGQVDPRRFAYLERRMIEFRVTLLREHLRSNSPSMLRHPDTREAAGEPC